MVCVVVCENIHDQYQESMGNRQTTELVMMGVYERWTHVQLSSFPKKKDHMPQNYSPQQIYDKRKKKQIWKGGGLRVRKVGMVEEIRGVVAEA